MTKEEHTQVAETILEQMGGRGRIGAMIGVKRTYLRNDTQGGGVTLTFRGRANKQINMVDILLDATDTYTMTFSAFRGKLGYETKKIVKECSSIYADMLKPVFEDITGLYLSL